MGRSLGPGTSTITSSSTTDRTPDPLLLALQPPPDESPEARHARERREAEAKKRSDEIDASIQAESVARRKKRGQAVRVLLLGQSESGKSTTVKS